MWDAGANLSSPRGLPSGDFFDPQVTVRLRTWFTSFTTSFHYLFSRLYHQSKEFTINMSEKKLAEEPTQVAQVEHANEKRTLSVTDATTPRIASGVNIIENPLTVRPQCNQLL